MKLIKYLLILLVSSVTLFSATQLKSVENLRVSKITDNSVSMTWEKIDVQPSMKSTEYLIMIVKK